MSTNWLLERVDRVFGTHRSAFRAGLWQSAHMATAPERAGRTCSKWCPRHPSNRWPPQPPAQCPSALPAGLSNPPP